VLVVRYRLAQLGVGLGQNGGRHRTEAAPRQPVTNVRLMPERHRVSADSPYAAVVGYSRAVRTDDRVEVAGTAPIWPDGSCSPDPYEQAKRCLEIIATALEELGASPDDVVRTRMFVTDARDWEPIGRAHGEVFAGIRPATTMVVVSALLDPRWRVEIEAEAVVRDVVVSDAR
jgi:enamine deaminase RidA (YjgF/YER057c/UK114 family)